MGTMCNKCLCTSKITLFKELDINEQHKIAHTADHFELGAGEFVVHENDKADFILIIREGKVKLTSFDADGKEYIYNIKVDSNIIGEEYLLKNTVFDYNVETITPTKFCKIGTGILFQKAKEDSLFAQKIILNLSNELYAVNNKLRLMMESDALRRISGFLLFQSNLIKANDIHLSLDDIAGVINLRKETVSRKFKELENSGLIQRVGHKKIKIVNIAELEKIFFES